MMDSHHDDCCRALTCRQAAPKASQVKKRFVRLFLARRRRGRNCNLHDCPAHSCHIAIARAAGSAIMTNKETWTAKTWTTKTWIARFGPPRQIAEQISAPDVIPDIIWTH